MKKKVLSICLICILLLTFVSCGNKAEDVPASEATLQESIAETEQMAAPEETEAATMPTLSAEFDLPEGESVESWDETGEDTSDTSTDIVISEEKQPEANTEPTEPAENAADEGCGCAYAEYLTKSPAEQEAYMNTFASPLDFIEWCKAAEAEHSAHVTVIEASGGNLDIGDYIN